MTPKEKAKELIINFQLQWNPLDYNQAKVCAIKCVEEILKAKPKEPLNYSDTIGYWNEILTELQKS